MTSIPQLKADINDLQRKLFAANAEIERLNKELTIARSVGSRPVIEVVGRTQYLQDPALVDMVRKLQQRVRDLEAK